MNTDELMTLCEDTVRCQSCGGENAVYQPATGTFLCAQTVRFMQKIQPEAHADLIIKEGAEKPTATVEVADEDDDEGETWTNFAPFNPSPN